MQPEKQNNLEEQKQEKQNLSSLRQLARTCNSILVISPSSSKGTKRLMIDIKNFEKKLIESETIVFKKHHAPFFRDLFYSQRLNFLNMIDDSSFIQDKKIDYHFGKDDNSIKAKNLRLHIYICHEKAYEMKCLAESKLTGEDEKADADIISSSEYTLYYELLYYIMDLIQRSLLALGDSTDRKKFSKSLRYFREQALIDDQNEVPSNSIGGIARNFAKIMGAEDVEIDEKQVENFMESTGKMLSNPKLAEFVDTMKPSIMEETGTKPKTLTEMMKGAVEKIGPILEMSMPTSNEPVPEGVTIETMASNLGKIIDNLPSSAEEKIEAIPKK